MCGRCEDLEGKVIYLESELGLRLEAAELASLARVLGLTAQLAKFALFLYRARGIPTTEQLHELLAGDTGHEEYSVNIISVHVHRLRKILGPGFVTTVWGVGYSLTPQGRDIIERALGESSNPAPPELREMHDRDSGDMRGLIAHIAGILAHRDADGGTQTAEMLRRIADRLSGPSRRVA